VSGLLALLGGQEHTEGCEAIDRRLLEEVGSDRPSVTVVLAASTPRRRAFKTHEAHAYWGRLGCDVQIAMAGGADETQRALDALAAPDIVVLTGGHPWLLHARLDRSPVLERILDLWHSGVPLSGSSAGAIALCEWRQYLKPPRPFRLVPGAFRVLPGTAAAPHFDRYGLHRWARAVSRRYPKLRILGLNDQTALVGRGDEFTVVGQHDVAMVQGGRATRFPVGATLEVGMPAGVMA